MPFHWDLAALRLACGEPRRHFWIRSEPQRIGGEPMTTSKETEWMNHPRLRKLVTAINELTLAERITLVKGQAMLGPTEIGPTTLLCDAAVRRPLNLLRRNDSPTAVSAVRGVLFCSLKWASTTLFNPEWML